MIKETPLINAPHHRTLQTLIDSGMRVVFSLGENRVKWSQKDTVAPTNRGFSHRERIISEKALIAQLVEQLSCKQQVAGSSPAGSSKKETTK